jgi:carboxyl-terminal processing protease
LVLEREVVPPPSVLARWLEHDVAYVRLKTFSETSASEVEDALERFSRERRIDRLILDLRGNSGGLLDQAVRIADFWIRDGVIVSTTGRGQRHDVERAHPVGTQRDYPMVVLVDEETASASEVLAGALQDHERARIMGSRTYGKGSVQTIIELEDGSALRLTVARYRTPRGRALHGTGLTPDLPFSAEPLAGRDRALEAAVAHLSTLAHGSGGRDPSVERTGSFTEQKGRVIQNR